MGKNNYIKNMWNYNFKLLFIILLPIFLQAQSKYFSEYEVKAAYLEKFTRFIDWPAKVHIEDTNKSFVLGIIGDDNFISIIEEKFAKQKIKNKMVEVVNVSTLDEIARCNLLVIAHSENLSINQVLSFTKNKPILTISDDIQNSKKGVLITLFVENNHVYFNINQNALRRSGLYASTLLLNLSRNISAEENEL